MYILAGLYIHTESWMTAFTFMERENLHHQTISLTFFWPWHSFNVSLARYIMFLFQSKSMFLSLFLHDDAGASTLLYALCLHRSQLLCHFILVLFEIWNDCKICLAVKLKCIYQLYRSTYVDVRHFVWSIHGYSCHTFNSFTTTSQSGVWLQCKDITMLDM